MAALAQVSVEDADDQPPVLLSRFLRSTNVELEALARAEWPVDLNAATAPPRREVDVLVLLEELYPGASSDAAIVRLVARDAAIVSVLLELPGAAAKAFGPRTMTRLEHFRDRESIGDEQLVVVLDVPLPRAHRRRLLREFDRSWWLPRTRSVGSRMFIDVR